MKVKDGAMAISAGMIISKLDDELQRKFIERYGNYQSNITKELAVRYCNEIFQYIGNSAWTQDDRDDFDGGCGVRCADCPFNTINVGCLFYEMKAETSTQLRLITSLSPCVTTTATAIATFRWLLTS